MLWFFAASAAIDSRKRVTFCINIFQCIIFLAGINNIYRFPKAESRYFDNVENVKFLFHFAETVDFQAKLPYTVSVMNENNYKKTEIIRLGNSPEEDRKAFERAGKILREEGLVAFPTETVYGLGGNGLDAEASRRIYAAKGRPSDNPLILHIADTAELIPLVKRIPETAKALMAAYWPGPMTLIFEKSDLVPPETTGGLSTVAVRMPSHPAAAGLIRAAGVPIAAPSANLSGRPSPTTAAHVAEDLSGRIDMILDGGPVEIGLESTILDVTGEVPVILRPGYLSREEVIRLIGACEVDPAVLRKPEPGLRPKAPGMKYRHYAPKAEVTLVEGEPEAVAAAICRMAEEARAKGETVRIICAEEHRGKYPAELVKSAGGRQEEVARSLYRLLREVDEEGAVRVYSETFREGELGAAIMNRLQKAAGYRLLQVPEGGEKSDGGGK